MDQGRRTIPSSVVQRFCSGRCGCHRKSEFVFSSRYHERPQFLIEARSPPKFHNYCGIAHPPFFQLASIAVMESSASALVMGGAAVSVTALAVLFRVWRVRRFCAASSSELRRGPQCCADFACQDITQQCSHASIQAQAHIHRLFHSRDVTHLQPRHASTTSLTHHTYDDCKYLRVGRNLSFCLFGKFSIIYG